MCIFWGENNFLNQCNPHIYCKDKFKNCIFGKFIIVVKRREYFWWSKLVLCTDKSTQPYSNFEYSNACNFLIPNILTRNPIFICWVMWMRWISKWGITNACNSMTRTKGEKKFEIFGCDCTNCVFDMRCCWHALNLWLKTDAFLIAQTCTNDADVIYSLVIQCL